MSAYHFRKAGDAAIWTVLFTLAFTAALAFTISNALTADTRSFAYFTGFLALLFAGGAVLQIRLFFRYYQKHVSRKYKP